MRLWELNWGEIRRDLVIGSCPVVPRDMERIADEARATAVLSLQEDRCRASLGIDPAILWPAGERRGLRLRNVPLRDFDAAHQRRHLVGAVRALRGLLGDGHRVYVHCTAGINRAPLVVLGELTFVEGMDIDDALALIWRGRPEASPYEEAWEGCRRDLLDARSADRPVEDADQQAWERAVLLEACAG